MSVSSSLTAELRGLVLRLQDDLRVRVGSQPGVESSWRAEYREALSSERTAASWESWVDERVTLAAVAWVLSSVFVRFCRGQPVGVAGVDHGSGSAGGGGDGGAETCSSGRRHGRILM